MQEDSSKSDDHGEVNADRGVSGGASAAATGLQENQRIAALLSELADLLEAQHANAFRVAAYRAAATTVSNLDRPIRQIDADGGAEALIRLPTIGESIAHLIDQYLHSGQMMLLQRLRGEASAERIFTTVPTIGPELAHRIYEHLHVETLPELFQACQDGRLCDVPGIGTKRARAIHDTLAERFGRSGKSMHAQSSRFPPVDRSVSVAEILDIDREYREKATADRLPRVAPQKFNPGHVAWLPILHTQRDDRHYTAVFSNTARRIN